MKQVKSREEQTWDDSQGQFEQEEEGEKEHEEVSPKRTGKNTVKERERENGMRKKVWK